MTRIQDDLFATVNAEWLENAEIPADKPRISAFDELVLKNEKNLAKDLADLENSYRLEKIVAIDSSCHNSYLTTIVKLVRK